MTQSLLLVVLSCFGQEIKIDTIELFKNEAGRPKCSPLEETIACHSRKCKRYYDISLLNTDGTEKICLTCDHPDLPNKHIGQPSWHPNGKWIIFQAEMKDHVLPNVGLLAVPGIGFHNDIYIMNIETKAVYQLTNLKTKIYIGDKTPTSAILQPFFNNNGTQVSWSERIDDGDDWGKWVIKIADIVFDSDKPKLINIKEYFPGINSGYYESNEFLPGDSVLCICGNLEKNQKEIGIDIYLLNLKTNKTVRLTNSLNYFDECPHPNHSGTKICYLSTDGFPNSDSKQWWKWAKGEFWIMNTDGTCKQQITHFNTKGYNEYTGMRTIPEYISWSPDDKTIFLGIAVEYKKGKLKDQIWKIKLS
ncbi:MAG: hypothetical protein ABIJ97_02365 [Bacteroidota bacterium]